MQRFEHFIDGVFCGPASGRWFDSFDPYTAKPWAQVAEGSSADVDGAVIAARRALDSGPWPRLTATERGALVQRLGDVVAAHAGELAELETRDNGKLFTEMLGQVNYVAQWYRYFGGLADKIEGTVPPMDKPGYFAFTRKEPVGVTALLTPWNSPLLLLTWKLAPALAAGCTAVIKPSEFASISTLEMARLFTEAGLPPGVVNVVTGYGADVGAPLVAHPLVNKIAFTGSDATGRHVASAAGRGLKQISLELGGKSPNIIFADADLESAVNGAVSGIFAATGQTCIAGSRLLVQRTVHDEVVQRLVTLASSARMGNPRHETTQVGPITTSQQYAKVLRYLEIALDEGAAPVLGGRPAQREECGGGWFIEPTIFTGERNAMRIAQEEVFGPVLAVIPFDDEDEAVAIANDSRYGLGAGVWTSDIARAFRMSERIRSGTVWVNT